MKLYGNQEEQAVFAGMLYGMNPKTVITYPAKEDIPFGAPVVMNNDGTVSVFDGDGEIAGVALFHQCEAGKYREKDAVAVIKSGFVYVELSTSGPDGEIKPGDVAYVNEEDGTFQKSSSGAVEVGTFESFNENGMGVLYLK